MLHYFHVFSSNNVDLKTLIAQGFAVWEGLITVLTDKSVIDRGRNWK